MSLSGRHPSPCGLVTHDCAQVKESAGDEVKEGVYVCSTEQHDLSGSKGTANLVLKFAKGSKKEASVNVQLIKGVTRDLTGGSRPHGHES